MGAVVVICLGPVFVSLLKEILAQYKTKEVAIIKVTINKYIYMYEAFTGLNVQ